MMKLLRTSGRLLIAIASTVVLILIIAWMSGFFRDKVQPGNKPFERREAAGQQTTEVTTLETPQLVDAVGTVEPRRKTDVASRLLASINQVTVNPGDKVQQGQLLCVLDDREIQAQFREVAAAVAGIEADLAVRRREYDRYKKMYSDHAVTKEDLDRIEGAYQVGQAQLQRMLEQANRMKIMLTYTQIKAQTSGIVGDRYVDPGDLAVPGKPLVTIHNPDELELNANVREGLAGKIHIGMQMAVRIDALSRNMVGTIREIVPRAEANSRSLLVKIKLPHDQLDGIYIGMFGRVSIPVDKLDRVVIDQRALLEIGQLCLVDVVRPDKILERRFVRTGEQFRDKKDPSILLREILSGLKPKETVVLPLNDEHECTSDGNSN